MRPLFVTFFATLALLGSVAIYSQLVANSRYLERASAALQDWAGTLPAPDPDDDARLIAEARRRARLYDDGIVERHLVDGMVVNRSLRTGKMMDHCDSLLFSSLRFVSLTKLGWFDRAREAWEGIQNAQQDGHWLRHPQCPQSTSRDMLLGLLAALSQEPPGFDDHLKTLITRVDRNNGYFSTGPVYVSYLSPGLARFIGMLMPAGKLGKEQLPEIIRDGYSTAELEVMVTDQGYQAHLGAITAWLEMELNTQRTRPPGTDSLFARGADALVAPFAASHLGRQRLDWITDQLVHTDRTNLFYRYLRLRAAGALTAAVRHNLLAELVAMPHFPRDRLPANCDRRADYLWQREIRDPPHNPVPCTEEYSGVDFLWVAALLMEGNATAEDIAH